VTANDIGPAPAGAKTARISFPPVQNGLDYPQSVIEHLQDSPGPRELKYAVLHLQAATEVLLKVRLIREHWSLVFKNPDKASRASFYSGEFQSINLEESLARRPDSLLGRRGSQRIAQGCVFGAAAGVLQEECDPVVVAGDAVGETACELGRRQARASPRWSEGKWQRVAKTLGNRLRPRSPQH
jgi:hypothetical protein